MIDANKHVHVCFVLFQLSCLMHVLSTVIQFNTLFQTHPLCYTHTEVHSNQKQKTEQEHTILHQRTTYIIIKLYRTNIC